MDRKTPKTIKLITFRVTDYWFALPLRTILKIVNCPPSSEGGIVPLGIVQLGSHTIQLIDLHSIFCPSTDISKQPSFLLILHSVKDQLWGITLESPPDLLELPISNFQTVSANKRFTPQKQWISHIAVFAEQKINRTLLLLDLKAIFQSEKTTVKSNR